MPHYSFNIPNLVKEKKQLELIIEQMIKYAQFNFTDKLDVIAEDAASSMVSGLITSLNILGEELEHKVKELERFNQQLENYNNFIKSVTRSLPETIYIFNHQTGSITYLSKCTNVESTCPCPVVLHNLNLPCAHCKVEELILKESVNYEVERLNSGEVSVKSPEQKTKWYKTTTAIFETDAEGSVISTLETLSDITILKEKEFELLENKKIISDSLKEKEVLLLEIHHRVKNNMQVILGLLNLQINRVESMEVVDELKEIQNHIYSMSLIHEELYKTDNFASVNVSSYCKKLCTNLSAFYNRGNNVEIIYNLESGIHLTMDRATLLGLIINEVICNCYKHGFKNWHKGIINVTLTSTVNNYLLEINNRARRTSSQKPSENLNQYSGINLIHDLASQLDAALKIKSGGYYCVELTIPKMPVN